MKLNQIVLGGIFLVLTFILAQHVGGASHKLAEFTLLGLALGYVMERSQIGFAGPIKKMYIMGNGSLAKSILFCFVLSVMVAAGIHYSAVLGGNTIPGLSSVKPVNLLSCLGGILFGAGMMFAGGCASGTLTDIGEGFMRAVIVLFFFCMGSILGIATLPSLTNSFLGGGPKVYLPEHLGYFLTVILMIVGFGVLYFIIKWYESKRKQANSYIEEEWAEDQKPIQDGAPFKILSFKTYHKLFIERWSFYTGAGLLSVCALLVLLSSGKTWGVSTVFIYWGSWMLDAVGINAHHSIPYLQSPKVVKALEKGIMAHAGSLRNIGFILGTLVAGLLACNFKLKLKVSVKEAIIYIIGGLLMGVGARWGMGCNIGAFYASFMAMSLSAYVFGTGLIIGGIAGLKILDKLKML
jgi:uncharacterized membrane protein YedE/YeeE